MAASRGLDQVTPPVLNELTFPAEGYEVGTEVVGRANLYLLQGRKIGLSYPVANGGASETVSEQGNVIMGNDLGTTYCFGASRGRR